MRLRITTSRGHTEVDIWAPVGTAPIAQELGCALQVDTAMPRRKQNTPNRRRMSRSPQLGGWLKPLVNVVNVVVAIITLIERWPWGR
jgi:hypothetical protein